MVQVTEGFSVNAKYVYTVWSCCGSQRKCISEFQSVKYV